MQHCIKRRETLLAELGDESIAFVCANRESVRSNDVNFPFRQDNHFYYLTGITEADAIAVFAPGCGRGEYILFNHELDPVKARWEGEVIGQERACSEFGVDAAFSIKDFKTQLADLLVGRRHVYFMMGENKMLEHALMDSVHAARHKARSGMIVPRHFHHLDILLEGMRVLKDEDEIACLRKAASASVQAHIEVMQYCAPGQSEYDLESVLLNGFRKRGCAHVAYSSIVGSGTNACVLHYTDNNAELVSGELVLIDAGGEYQHYAADITRTFPVNGKFSQEQKAIYDIVLLAQTEALALVKPGVKWNALQDKIVEVLTQGLVDNGILKGDVAELIERQAYMPFYMHKSGHWLGLDVHDIGLYKVNGEWVTFAPGMVLTVEPGLYISESADVDEKWWNIGVRIEDDVLVTESGFENLTAGLPRTTDEIETLMAG